MTHRLIVLAHGYTKQQNDMDYLQDHLRALGYDTLSLDLPLTFGSKEEAITSFYQQIQPELTQYRTISFVAHSIGGLVVRWVVQKHRLKNLGNSVFIGTPHGGTALADIASLLPPYALIFQPIKELRSSTRYPLFPSDRDFKLGLIAGTECEGVLGSIFLKSENDGRVEVSSVHSEDEDAFVTVPFSHKKMHHRLLTAKLVARFIQHGDFELE